MNKQLWPGVALGLSLLLSSVVYANSVRDTSDTTVLQKTEQSSSPASLEGADPSKPEGPYRDRATGSSQDMGARWSSLDRASNSELMAFTSTYAAQNATQLMGGKSSSLSFANFGRVPFYQMLALTNDVNSNSTNKTTPRPSASLPEPTTLALLGVGLAALAAGLRKRDKNSHK